MVLDIAECSLDPANERRQFVTGGAHLAARFSPEPKGLSHAKRQLQSIDHGSGRRDRLIA